MDFHILKEMTFQDNFLTYKPLEGEQHHESWLRFKTLFIQYLTIEIPDVVLLESLYMSLCSGKRVFDDKLIPCCIVRKPFVIAS